MSEFHENNIEWYTGDNTATASFSQAKFINKFKKIAEERDDVQVVAQNKDGSICVKFPVKWVKILPSRQMSEEDRIKIAERLNAIRPKQKSNENSV